jgi:hypothetical protein
MNRNMTQHKQPENIPLKDVSRFNRWIHHLDEKDKLLRPETRKRKWIISLAVLFLLFVLSFILFPWVKMEYKNLDVTNEQVIQTLPDKNQLLPLEMPVDSFEQRLKKQIHETNPEKE